MSILGTTDVVFEISTKLFCQSQQDLVLVVDRVLKERNELVPGAIVAEGKSYGGYAMDGVESELDVF